MASLIVGQVFIVTGLEIWKALLAYYIPYKYTFNPYYIPYLHKRKHLRKYSFVLYIKH